MQLTVNVLFIYKFKYTVNANNSNNNLFSKRTKSSNYQGAGCTKQRHNCGWGRVTFILLIIPSDPSLDSLHESKSCLIKKDHPV